jgi:hypothetical protein
MRVRSGRATPIKRPELRRKDWAERRITTKRHFALGLRAGRNGRKHLPHCARMEQREPVTLTEMVHLHRRYRVVHSRADRSCVKARCEARENESSRTKCCYAHESKRNELCH